MVSNANDTKNIELLLPNGTAEKIVVENYYTTVTDLKATCECVTGIPTELQKLHEDHLNQELHDGVIVTANTVRLEVPIWWNKIICSVLNNEVQSVHRRVQLPMQQVGQNERIFVALFMGCARATHEMVSQLVKLENTINLMTTTDTGKSLLHACAVGGNVKCLDIVVKHLLKDDNSSFGHQDYNKESPYELAVRLGNKELANQLLVYSKESSMLPEPTKLPHQKQANEYRKTNNNPIINERFEHEDKHYHEWSDNTNITSIETENEFENQMQTSFKTSQHQPLVRKPCLKRQKERNGSLSVRIRVDNDQDEQDSINIKRTSFLPSLNNGGVKFEKEKVFRTASLPNSPFASPRSSPINDIIDNCKSAPNSPLLARRTFRAAGLAARFALVPSPPRIQVKTTGENLGNLRRGSLAVISENGKNRQRQKSRSVCEVTFRESLSTHKKVMDSEERQELPWNAWIAAKKQEALAPMPEENQLKPPQSPGQSRRRSFVQWLNDKDIDVLRKQHASLQGQEAAGASGKKGKSFEEWLEDKHMESKREKEKEKEKEEALKTEQEIKMRRRRMSQQKYQSWLQAKELKALEAEEKLLGEAKNKFEKMKIKWEEEDEMKKRTSKVNVGRTNSCPAESSSASSTITRQRFHSVQSK